MPRANKLAMAKQNEQITRSPDHRAAAPQAIILAAGRGTRMPGQRPKVLYEVCNRPMLSWVIQACRDAGVCRCIIVVGYGADQIRQFVAKDKDCTCIEQAELLGTGHAVLMAKYLFENQPVVDVFVLTGDGPLIRPHTLSRLLEVHRTRKGAATLATAIVDDPSNYGRIVRDDAGEFQFIVEEQDASPTQQKIREINPSYYCFRSDALFDGLDGITTNTLQNEYYITDVPGLLRKRGLTVTVERTVPADEALSINTPDQLEQVDLILSARIGCGAEVKGA